MECAVSVAEIRSTILYRPFEARDIDAAHALSVQVKWPHRADDWRFVLDAGAGFIAQEGERVVGTALYWKFGEDAGSLGMVIVAPDRQGHGIGRKLMELLLDALGSRVTLLHATPAGQPLYDKLGFEPIGTLHQHQSADFRAPAILLQAGESLRPLESADTPRLAELASRAAGVDRGAILQQLLGVAQGVALESGGEIVGFALMRPFGRGHAIGPVIATGEGQERLQRAQALVAHWLAANEGAFTRMDTPGDSGLTPWLEQLGLRQVDAVVKMARNGAPRPDASVGQFGIVNQAVG
nr:GNAT family N-acetyltransferase [Caballeronia sp. GACF4]